MKKLNILAIILLPVLFIGLIISSCSTNKNLITQKSGAQLWGESCIRCHNTPSPETFSDVDWDVAIMHMRVRAQLTEEEALKIVEFLKSAN